MKISRYKLIGDIYVFRAPASRAGYILALLVLGSATAWAAEPYQFTTFDVPFQAPPAAKAGGTSDYAINNHGVIVGSYGVSNRFRADGKTYIVDGFIFEHGAFSDVAIAGAVQIDLMSVNDRGTIVGDYKDATGHSYNFVLSRHGTLTVLPPVTAGALIAARAIGINNQETIVGAYSLDPTFPLPSFRGFILRGGHYETFDYPGGHGTVLQQINDRGTILGRTFDTAQNSHGFLLHRHGALTDVEVPGSLNTMPLGINNRDEVVGIFHSPDQAHHSFVLSGGVYTTLDLPGADVDTSAYGINDRGEIVGFYNTGKATDGFIATPIRGSQPDPGQN